MIRFPETLQLELEALARAANKAQEIRHQIEHDLKVQKETEVIRVRYEAKLIHQQELDAEQTPALEMGTLADYKNNPVLTPTDLIEGVVKSEGLCIMLGPSGSGKSTVALQMLHSLSTGEDWLGQPAKPLMGSVGVVSYDMDASMVYDWMSGYPNMDPSRVSVVNAYKRGNPLGVTAMRQQIAATWKAMNVEVVVIDSFSASFFGENQNDAAQTMHHYRDLKLFALTEVGAKAVIVIVHSTPDTPHKARGSTTHHDVADSIVSVEELKDHTREVRMVKYRAARGQHQMNPVIIGAPDDVTHLVDLDTGAMTLAGMTLPPGYAGAVFPDLPDAVDDPDTDSEQEDDDL